MYPGFDEGQWPSGGHDNTKKHLFPIKPISAPQRTAYTGVVAATAATAVVVCRAIVLRLRRRHSCRGTGLYVHFFKVHMRRVARPTLVCCPFGRVDPLDWWADAVGVGQHGHFARGGHLNHGQGPQGWPVIGPDPTRPRTRKPTAIRLAPSTGTTPALVGSGPSDVNCSSGRVPECRAGVPLLSTLTIWGL